MPVRRFALGSFACLLALLAAGRAAATIPPVPSTRSMGMASSLRGSAMGDAALALNPSGMSLARTYVLEAAYLYDRPGDGQAHNGHISVVDSTSAFNVAGGLYYTYLTEGRDNAPGRSGHEAGLALSFPIGDRVFLGALLKYLRLRNDDPVPPGTSRLVSGFGFDLGATVRPASMLTIGVAATNVAGAQLGDRAPRTLGGGVTVGVTNEVLLALDAVVDVTDSTRKVWRFVGGAEFLVANRLALRAGGGRRGDTGAALLAGGLSLISEVAALDFGVQQDLAGARKELVVGVSGRVFVPSP
jgi:hypothetical protein